MTDHVEGHCCVGLKKKKHKQKNNTGLQLVPVLQISEAQTFTLVQFQHKLGRR